MNTGLQWALWAIVFSAFMGWLARAARRQAQQYTGEELRQPVVLLVVGVVTGGPFFVGAVAALVFGGEERWTALVFGGLALVGGYLVWEYWSVRYRLLPGGFSFATPFGGRGLARWQDVRRVGYSASMKWFWLELESGRVVRLSVMLLGLERFAAALLEHAPGAIEPATRPLVEATARGSPPSIWG